MLCCVGELELLGLLFLFGRGEVVYDDDDDWKEEGDLGDIFCFIKGEDCRFKVDTVNPL